MLAWHLLSCKKIHTVSENSIATIKMRNHFCYPLKIVIFSIAPHLVIALPTLR